MTSLRQHLGGLAVLALLVTSVGCDDDKDPATTGSNTRQVQGLSHCAVKSQGYYYIAELLGFTGSLASVSVTLENSILLALSEINDAGGVKGRKLGLVKCDTAVDQTTAATAMQELAQVPEVSAVIGALASSSTIAAAPTAKSAQKVLMSPSSTSPAITSLDDGGFVMRTCASDAHQGVVAATVAKESNITKVFTIHRSDAYGEGLRDAFAGSFADATHQVSAAGYNEADPEYAKVVVDAAEAYAPQAIFLVGYQDDGAAVVKEVKDRDMTPTWLFADGLKEASFITKVGDNAFLEGVLGTAPAAPSGTEYDAFVARYQADWNAEPQVFNSNSYDAAYLLAMAMELSDDPANGTQIRDNLAKTYGGSQPVHGGDWTTFLQNTATGTFDYVGASGPLDFDVNGDVLSDYSLWTIEAGVIKATGCRKPDGTVCP